MTELKVIRCVPCPDKYNGLVRIDEWCIQCEFNETFKSDDNTIVCGFDEGE
jgi:hypothetical protein